MTSSLLRVATAVVMMASSAWVTTAAAGPVPGQGTWETTLQARDLDGDTVTDAFYDTALNITWLRNANVNGAMNWTGANTWANNLTFGGYNDWRLPTTVDTAGPGCDVSVAGGTDCGANVDPATSEMAHLFYVTLGNLAFCPPGNATCTGPGVPQAGWGLTNTGAFMGLDPVDYWSNLEDITGDAWKFNFFDGTQGPTGKSNLFNAIAVRSGDVATAISEPQSVAMVLMGLAAAGVVRRRRPR